MQTCTLFISTTTTRNTIPRTLTERRNTATETLARWQRREGAQRNAPTTRATALTRNCRRRTRMVSEPHPCVAHSVPRIARPLAKVYTAKRDTHRITKRVARARGGKALLSLTSQEYRRFHRQRLLDIFKFLRRLGHPVRWWLSMATVLTAGRGQRRRPSLRRRRGTSALAANAVDIRCSRVCARTT